MDGRVKSVRNSPAELYTVLLVGDVFALEGLRFHFGTGTHSSLRKGCAHFDTGTSDASFEIVNVQHCQNGSGAFGDWSWSDSIRFLYCITYSRRHVHVHYALSIWRFRGVWQSSDFAPSEGDFTNDRHLRHPLLLPIHAQCVCGHFDTFHADIKISCKMGAGKKQNFHSVKKCISAGPVRIFCIRAL